MLAAGMGRIEAVNTLLARGADVNAKSPGGYTALMAAALNDHRDVVVALLKHSADINAKDVGNQTALKYATSKRNNDVAQILKNAGAKE